MAQPQRPSRLGRGLSSLMARPVEVAPPPPPDAPAEDESPAAPPSRASSGAGKPSPAARPAPPVKKAAGRGETAGQQPTQAPTGPASAAAVSSPASPPDADGLVYLPISQIRPNPHQPRQVFDEASLHRLAESIRSEGLMQPVIVRPVAPGAGAGGAAYELVAGERRWRAAQLAGLAKLPTIVRPLDDRQVAEWALIENLQREDLNPLERAEAFHRLIQAFSLSHEQIAERVGVERSSVSNALRLLSLDPQVRDLIKVGRLSAGQAKALAGLGDPKQQRLLAERAVKFDWSVRQVELAVRQAVEGHDAAMTPAPLRPAKPSHLSDLEEQIARQLQTRVKLSPGRKKGTGTLSIEFHSIDQFDALLARLGVQAE